MERRKLKDKISEIFSTSVTEVFWYPKMQGRWNFSWEVSDPNSLLPVPVVWPTQQKGPCPPCCPTRIAAEMGGRLCRALALMLLAVLCGRASLTFQMESQWDRLIFVLLDFYLSQKALKHIWSGQMQLIYISDRTLSLYCHWWAGAEIQFFFRKTVFHIWIRTTKCNPIFFNPSATIMKTFRRKKRKQVDFLYLKFLIFKEAFWAISAPEVSGPDDKYGGKYRGAVFKHKVRKNPITCKD